MGNELVAKGICETPCAGIRLGGFYRNDNACNIRYRKNQVIHTKTWSKGKSS